MKGTFTDKIKKEFKNLFRIKNKKRLEMIKKMLFKNFIKNLNDEVKGYKARLEILNNSELDFEDVATDEELEIYGGEKTALYDFFDYYNLSRIRDYIGKIIEKITEGDSRYDDYITWYFDLDGKPELMEELLKKMLNTDENIFTDEVEKAIFKILLCRAEGRNLSALFFIYRIVHFDKWHCLRISIL